MSAPKPWYVEAKPWDGEPGVEIYRVFEGGPHPNREFVCDAGFVNTVLEAEGIAKYVVRERARLIAAAPEMLEALRKCKTCALATEVRELVNAAIDKATGAAS